MAVPTITSVTPAAGPQGGDTTVAVVGTGFTGTTGVAVGGTAATSFAVVSDTSLTVVVPLHAAGLVDIIVTNATGPSVAGAGDEYTYVATAPVTYIEAVDHTGNVQYFEDIAITPANLASGAILARLNPQVYPQRGLIEPPAQSTAAVPSPTPAAVNHG